MKALVVYGTRYGATGEIAEAIAGRLRSHGIDADALPAEAVGKLEGVDAFVIGSSVYIDHWRKETRAFVEQHREMLAARPTWLFSSGPLGTEQTDEEGRDLREVTEPKEIAEVEEMIHPRGHTVFFGALDPKKLAPHHRLLRLLPAGRKLLPKGDFRDWGEIDAWADGIAEELAGVPERPD